MFLYILLPLFLGLFAGSTRFNLDWIESVRKKSIFYCIHKNEIVGDSAKYNQKSKTQHSSSLFDGKIIEINLLDVSRKMCLRHRFIDMYAIMCQPENHQFMSWAEASVEYGIGHHSMPPLYLRASTEFSLYVYVHIYAYIHSGCLPSPFESGDVYIYIIHQSYTFNICQRVYCAPRKQKEI